MPAYDELILLAHRDDLGRPELRRFLTAVESATAWTVNHPDEAWAVVQGAPTGARRRAEPARLGRHAAALRASARPPWTTAATGASPLFSPTAA